MRLLLHLVLDLQGLTTYLNLFDFRPFFTHSHCVNIHYTAVQSVLALKIATPYIFGAVYKFTKIYDWALPSDTF